MSFVKAKEHISKFGLEGNIILLSISSATVTLAAEALKCRECDIAKTLSFIVDDNIILIVTAGDKKIDNAKYKNYFHTKAKMVPKEQVLDLVGHEIGGVCPFGVNDNIKIYLDISLKELEVVYPACGSHDSAIRLTIDELTDIVDNPTWIDVCKNI